MGWGCPRTADSQPLSGMHVLAQQVRRRIKVGPLGPAGCVAAHIVLDPQSGIQLTARRCASKSAAVGDSASRRALVADEDLCEQSYTGP